MPTAEELAELAAWLQSTGHEADEAKGTAECAYVAVFDDYCTDCPGYCGKLMAVVWSGSPTFFDVFTWQDGKLERSGRDYDQHECYRCGSTGGTLCWDCWRRYERRILLFQKRWPIAEAIRRVAVRIAGVPRTSERPCETSPAHTPGPWISTATEGDWHHVIRSSGERGTVVATVENLDSESEEAANARLIAAAPKLLDHLKNIVEMAHSVSANWESGDLADAVRNMDRIATAAEVAISKAKGNL